MRLCEFLLSFHQTENCVLQKIEFFLAIFVSISYQNFGKFVSKLWRIRIVVNLELLQSAFK